MHENYFCREKRLSQERSLLRGQVELLQDQLEKRVVETTQLKNDHSSQLVQLQHDLHTASTEVSCLTNPQLLKTPSEHLLVKYSFGISS